METSVSLIFALIVFIMVILIYVKFSDNKKTNEAKETYLEDNMTDNEPRKVEETAKYKSEYSDQRNDSVVVQLALINESLKEMNKKMNSMANSIGLIAFIIAIQFFGAIFLVLWATQGFLKGLNGLF